VSFGFNVLFQNLFVVVDTNIFIDNLGFVEEIKDLFLTGEARKQIVHVFCSHAQTFESHRKVDRGTFLVDDTITERSLNFELPWSILVVRNREKFQLF
jgi:hypothetical protein